MRLGGVKEARDSRFQGLSIRGFLGEWTYILGLAAGRCRGAGYRPVTDAVGTSRGRDVLNNTHPLLLPMPNDGVQLLHGPLVVLKRKWLTKSLAAASRVPTN